MVRLGVRLLSCPVIRGTALQTSDFRPTTICRQPQLVFSCGARSDQASKAVSKARPDRCQAAERFLALGILWPAKLHNVVALPPSRSFGHIVCASTTAVLTFVWLCLHADRSLGTLSCNPADLARALGKEEGDIKRALEELERKDVCALRSDGVVEICDRFWPYQRRFSPGTNDESRRYIDEVRRVFLERRCVQGSFTIGDEKMALSLYKRGVSLIHVQRAILLGTVRKYAAIVQKGRGTPISGLHYFTSLFEEVEQETSPQYWEYVARKVGTFEQTWAGFNPREAKQ